MIRELFALGFPWVWILLVLMTAYKPEVILDWVDDRFVSITEEWEEVLVFTLAVMVEFVVAAIWPIVALTMLVRRTRKYCRDRKKGKRS